ncbi:DUF4230 domain-containing protein [Pedobacter heparinus]|uniref:DUF4230 domain-containing protein n=1 Tax=Pedobacter heparinus (strain ATCC 13125 / DSM 2366 / CIP 104194 / JCM 7457 / NBRC 12017 / NCIMB 9290 / NRRL B-14731 / HIM 762-3) TaxID=485917 RepID=C6XSC3_PEDHD|nr:DUF4230 domain-containing protein [Pedobacter heparinus]ACU03468.1 hypothetical protein Phep_1252 [Pedobacter heparinus DSM 2366]
MIKLLKISIVVAVISAIAWFIAAKFSLKTTVESKHQLLLDRVESMGKLELIKYRISDILEHKNKTPFLPEASVLLIIKADAVGCIDLTKLKSEDIQVYGDSAVIKLPQPEICYIKIDHKASRVYDTKMAFFREADLVDEAYKNAEQKIADEVRKSDILQQTRVNALNVLRPILTGLGFSKMTLTFENVGKINATF